MLFFLLFVYFEIYAHEVLWIIVLVHSNVRKAEICYHLTLCKSLGKLSNLATEFLYEFFIDILNPFLQLNRDIFI